MLLCINSLNVEKDVRSINRLQKKPVQQNDPDYIKPYRGLITAHAYEKMLSQLKHIDRFEFDEVRDGIGFYQREDGNILTESAKCNCVFFDTMGLSCRHIIKLRLHLRLDAFDPNLCIRRWHRQHALKASLIERNYALQFETTAPENHVLTQNEKYRKANDVLDGISDILSLKNQNVFNTYIDVLGKAKDLVAQGKMFAVVEIDTGSFFI